LFVTLPTWANEPGEAPSPWATRKYAVGVGYSGSTVEADVERDGDDQIVFGGWSIFGRAGLTERWGIQFGYRSMEDAESYSSGEEITLDLVGAHAYWIWLETKHSRWHAKFGLTWMEFESKTPTVTRVSDLGVTPSIGTGFEWGSPKYAFFVDFGVTVVDIELIPGNEESLLVGNTITGFIYKF
jgi:hypothetical protein